MTIADFVPFPGIRVRDVAIFGHQIDVYISPQQDELRRREELGLGAFCDASGIRTLDVLPSGIRVPSTLLDALDHLCLSTLPPGAIEATAQTMTRLAVAPVRVNGIARAIKYWDDAAAMTLLRTHAPRIVIAAPRLANRVIRNVDPELGVAVTWGETPVLVRSPGSHAVRHSWQRWLLAELAYASWRASPQDSAFRQA